MRRCMDLQLMDYRNSSKCASANPALCFPNAAAPWGRHVRRRKNARRRSPVYRGYLCCRLTRALLFLARCTAPPPPMTTSTRTPLCIRPSRLLGICWPAASLVSWRHRTGVGCEEGDRAQRQVAAVVMKIKESGAV